MWHPSHSDPIRNSQARFRPRFLPPSDRAIYFALSTLALLYNMCLFDNKQLDQSKYNVCRQGLELHEVQRNSNRERIVILYYTPLFYLFQLFKNLALRFLFPPFLFILIFIPSLRLRRVLLRLLFLLNKSPLIRRPF